MTAQVERIWQNVEQYGKNKEWNSEIVGQRELLDNSHWLGGLGILHFLKTMGNGARLGTMLGRDT